MSAAATAVPPVLCVRDLPPQALTALLGRYGLELTWLAADAPIPGSYWGGCEAGLKGARLYARPDTPVHSVLHEASHFICMSPGRRRRLDRDAGGDDAEETAVCCLQVLLAGALEGVGCARLMQDMDAWGYSFRLGSTRAWFEHDAADAHAWLAHHGITGAHGTLSGRARRAADT